MSVMLSRNLLSLSIFFTFLVVNTLVCDFCSKSSNYLPLGIKNIVHPIQIILQCNIFAME